MITGSRSWSSALIVAAALLGGCSLMSPVKHNPDHPEHPLSDDQATSQVVDAAKQIAKVAALQSVSGGFSWESCNDQGAPPYRGRVDMTFQVPTGVDRNAYFEQIAKTMEANGWSGGPPPEQHVFGTAIHQGGVMASIGISPFLGADGAVQLFGECRNMSNHRFDNGYSIKDQLRSG